MTTPRLAILLAAMSMVVAACSDVPHAEYEPPEGFVPFVADSNDNVGLGNDIAVDAEGVPYVSYFGFEAKLEEGEIPVARPVGAPFTPAVQVASLADDGAWTLGAVAQAREFSNVPVPFGPSLVASLKTLDPDNANGTSTAVAESGVRHVAWASNNGIWYAESSESSSVEQISKYGTTLNVAGALGRPGIAVDGNTPWVAWTASARGGHEVRVATPAGERWREEVVARIECADCRAPAPTGIGITSSGPLVVFADHSTRSVMAARQQGAQWTSETVATDVTGLGLSLDVDRDTARASYYADGTVDMAVSEGTSWNTTEVGEAGQVEPGAGDVAPTTDVTVDSEGIAYVAWYDAGSDSVKLTREVDGAFEEIETSGTEGGRSPSLAAGGDGRVYLAWYDASTEDLLVGVLGEVGELVLARPSPTQDVAAPGPIGTCEPDGGDLQIVAQGTAFDPTCLAVPPGDGFSVAMDNQDPFAHNFSIYVDDSFTEGLEGYTTPLDPGVVGTVETYEFPPIEDEATYFFQCDFHPVPAMRGTFIVGSGGDGGGGQ